MLLLCLLRFSPRKVRGYNNEKDTGSGFKKLTTITGAISDFSNFPTISLMLFFQLLYGMIIKSNSVNITLNYKKFPPQSHHTTKSSFWTPFPSTFYPYEYKLWFLNIIQIATLSHFAMLSQMTVNPFCYIGFLFTNQMDVLCT